ncbi:MAG: hypothetical protein R3B09_11415 [Nannocystaceae bacterium]
MPPPIFLETDLEPEAAAAKLLADSKLDPVELAGAHLAPWPATTGYVVSGGGRPLAAFDSDEDGRIRAYIDAIVYQDQMEALLPRAVEVTRSALDLLFPGWPAMIFDAKAGRVDLDLGDDVEAPELLVLSQDEAGKREVRKKVALTPGKRNRVDGLPTVQGAARVVLVLRGRHPGGDPLLWEHVLAPDADTIPAVPAPYVAPEISEPSPDQDDDDDSLLLLGGDEGGLLPLPMDYDSEDEEDPEPEDEATPGPQDPSKAKPGDPATKSDPAKSKPGDPATKSDPAKTKPGDPATKSDPAKAKPGDPATKTDPAKTKPSDPTAKPPANAPPASDPPAKAPSKPATKRP